MPNAAVIDRPAAEVAHANLPLAARAFRANSGADDAFAASRRASLRGSTSALNRLAALLVSISRNNAYEGRDPRSVPDALTSGFVSELLGLDVDALASLLVELERRGLVSGEATLCVDANGASPVLRLTDMAALEALADTD